jgi:hypothetical protein
MLHKGLLDCCSFWIDHGQVMLQLKAAFLFPRSSADANQQGVDFALFSRWGAGDRVQVQHISVSDTVTRDTWADVAMHS